MCISDFSNYELLTIVNSLAIAINNEFSSNDTLILASFFTLLGDSLALLSLGKNTLK